MYTSAWPHIFCALSCLVILMSLLHSLTWVFSVSTFSKQESHEEPQPRDAPAKKRKHAVSAQPGEEDIDDIIHRKCAGIMEVPLSTVVQELEISASAIIHRHRKGQRLPWKVPGQHQLWLHHTCAESVFSVPRFRGNLSLHAAKEMADDDRTIRNTAWRVRVYQDLSEVEAVKS